MSESFCVLPWNHLATHPHGGVSLCCRVDYTDGEGLARDWTEDSKKSKFLALGENSLNEVMNSRLFRETRLQMLRGETPAACKGCHLEESHGLISKRQRENAAFPQLSPEKARALTAADGSLRVLNFENVELRLGNRCNLKCRSCNPASSVKWHGEYQELQGALPFVRSYPTTLDFSWPDDPKFWGELLASSEGLRVLSINGGEPTLIERHWTFLKDLIANGRAAKIELSYNSNLTYLPAHAIEIWKAFKAVHIGASFDDIGDRNRYIRFPADWSTLLANFRRLKEAGISVGITQTVSAYNFFYLDEMWDFARREGVAIFHNHLYDPDYLSPKALPRETRLRALKKIKSGLPAGVYSELESMYADFDEPELWARFRDYNRELDRLRRQKFPEVFGELVDVLESHGHAWGSA